MLEKLIDAGLVSESVEISTEGRNARLYERRIGRLLVRFDHAGRFDLQPETRSSGGSEPVEGIEPGVGSARFVGGLPTDCVHAPSRRRKSTVSPSRATRTSRSSPYAASTDAVISSW